MTISRRVFISGSAAALGVPAINPNLQTAQENMHGSQAVVPTPRSTQPDLPGFDPVVDVDAAAIRHNVAEVGRLCNGRPILAVVKNNGYGLGVTNVGRVLDMVDAVAGMAVVKAEEAMALRDAGVRKPVLLMGLFSELEGAELAARNIHLAPYADGFHRTFASYAASMGREIPVQVYVDTGINRVGVPFRKAIPLIEKLAAEPGVRIDGAFTCFAEDDEYDSEQLRRFMNVAITARNRGINLGQLHAASSHGVFFRASALLDMVRPGLLLYGAYPAGAAGLRRANLRPAFSLRTRVVRVEQLEVGDAVGYGLDYVAKRATWAATLPVGHVDGYPRSAVNGCEVMIGNRLFKVVGAVSASHTIVELGGEKLVETGDIATLIGPDNSAIHPNTVAERAGVSVYDVLTHLCARLPKRIVGS